MSKAALSSYIIDCALTEAGEVKIYELGRLFSTSVTNGYKHVTRKNAYEETGQYYQEITGLPVYQEAGYVDDSRYPQIDRLIGFTGSVGLNPCGDNFNPESLRSHAAVFIPFAPPVGLLFESFRAETDDKYFIHTDSNPVLNMAFTDKAVSTALLNMHAPDLLPKSSVYDAADINSMLDDFGDHSKFVVKRPVDANGDGVFFVNKNALRMWHTIGAGQFYLNYIAGVKRTQNLAHTVIDLMTFRKPGLRDNFNLTAEAVTTGKPVRKGLFSYTPATRAIFSAVHDEGETTLKMHGTYHKLPKWPKGFGLLTERATMLSSIKNAFNSKPNAKAVEPADEDHIREVLQKGLHRAFHSAFMTDPATFATQCLDANDTGTRLVALNIINSPGFYDPQAERNQWMSNELRKRFVDMIAENNHFAKHAMRYVHEMHQARAKGCAGDEEVGFYKDCEKAYMANHASWRDRLRHNVTKTTTALC